MRAQEIAAKLEDASSAVEQFLNDVIREEDTDHFAVVFMQMQVRDALKAAGTGFLAFAEFIDEHLPDEYR